MSEELGLKNKKSINFSEWYLEVIKKGKIVDYSGIKGFLIFRENGLYIFEKYMKYLENLLGKIGYKKFYFPLLIPESLLRVEKNHIAGFENQVFWVDYGGNTKLEERLAIRPTSETIMYNFFKQSIFSYRDLPLKVHQTVSVFRYETKSTKPLIRDREILWNEAHSAHSSLEEVRREMKKIYKIYKKVFDYCCLPIIFVNVKVGIFAGAIEAWEAYTIFPDGKALEMCSINNLAQKFSKAFGIKFLNRENKEEYVYQGCYGISERVIAAIIAIHGDDKGLILPPTLSPLQVVIIPIFYNEEQRRKVLEYCEKVLKALKRMKIRVGMDVEEKTPGYKFNEYELYGVPLRIEIGEKEINENKITIAIRLTGKKTELNFSEIKNIKKMLEEIQYEMLKRAYDYFKEKISRGKIEKGKISIVNICQNCFEKVDKDFEIIGVPLENSKVDKCIYCNNQCEEIVLAETY